MKILFVFTGGTIGSTRTGHTISTDSSKPYKIIDKYAQVCGIDFEYDTCEPYTVLSENSTGESLRLLCECVREKIGAGYDGIVVTHGTDTLQYSSCAIGYAIGLCDTPVCVVSSNYPIEDERSNAIDNLRCAIALIKSRAVLGARGAFVTYRNPDGITRAYRATRLLASNAFTDEVRTIGGEFATLGCGYEIKKCPSYTEQSDLIEPLSASALVRVCEQILVVSPYVGMKYPSLDGIKCVILNSYHSGTINTESPEAIAFFESANEKGVKLFITGTIDGPEYESATLFQKYNIGHLFSMSPIAAYIKLWLIVSEGRCDTEMTKSLGGDLI